MFFSFLFSVNLPHLKLQSVVSKQQRWQRVWGVCQIFFCMVKIQPGHTKLTVKLQSVFILGSVQHWVVTHYSEMCYSNVIIFPVTNSLSDFHLKFNNYITYPRNAALLKQFESLVTPHCLNSFEWGLILISCVYQQLSYLHVVLS